MVPQLVLAADLRRHPCRAQTGEYVPARVTMRCCRRVAGAVMTDFMGYMLSPFDNGKVAKVELSAYYTKTNRRKLINAYSDKAPLATALQILEDCDVLLTSSSGRRLLMNTALIAPKTTKSTQGVAVMNLKKPTHCGRANLPRRRAAEPVAVQKEDSGARRTAEREEGGGRSRCKKSALRQDRLAFRLCRRVACAAERSVLLKGGQHTVRTMDCAARPGKPPLV